MIFDILVLLGLGILSGLGINMAYKSHRQFIRVQAFSTLHLSLAQASRQQMQTINRELKMARNTLNAEIETITPMCPYGRQGCGLCAGGKCVLERTSTRSQKEDK